MSLNNTTLTLAFMAASATLAYHVAAHGDEDGETKMADGSGPLLGVFSDIDDDIGDHVDVHMQGVAPVIYGGTVARGDELTADAQSRAITRTDPATPLLGKAMVSGVENDRGSVLL